MWSYQIIKSLKSKNSNGFDGVPSKFVKLRESESVHPLTNIIAQETFPDNLKIAKVYPKFEQGDRTEAPNYRPISLITTF